MKNEKKTRDWGFPPEKTDGSPGDYSGERSKGGGSGENFRFRFIDMIFKISLYNISFKINIIG